MPGGLFSGGDFLVAIFSSRILADCCGGRADVPGGECVEVNGICYPACEGDKACFIVVVNSRKAVQVCLSGLNGLE